MKDERSDFAQPTADLLPPSATANASPDANQAMRCLESAQTAHQQIEKLAAENEQLADEVLRNYEQMSLLFDFSTRITGVTAVDATMELLLDRCAALMSVERVYVRDAEAGWRCYSAADRRLFAAERPDAPDQILNQLVDEAVHKLVVTVHATPDVQIAAAPLRCGESVAAIVALRDADAGEFTSGHMQLLESLLTFGGQLLANNMLHEKLRLLSMEAMRALVSAIDKKDNYTCGHSGRVGFFARMVGERLGLPGPTLDRLEWSGLLHDVGKIGIAEEVLNKPGRLSNDEFDHIKQHPRMGYEILEPIQSFADVRQGVLHHHENIDGSGYPDGLSGEEIPLFARIIRIVDAFDAMGSRRAYRDAIPIERTLDILRSEAGSKLDPRIAEVFINFLGEFRETQPAVLEAMLNPYVETEATP